jgi:metal-dependent amidase/aminoacylase/carboxypeptidase family protein
MEKHGFKVERHYKLPTAWRATYTHACGHNLIAIAGVGVALAVRDAIVKHDIPGTVVLLGTPGKS